MEKRQKFKDKLVQLFAAKGKSWFGLLIETGVDRSTVWRGIKTKSVICAIAYYMEMRAEDLVADTELEDIWYS